jgi:cytochrome c biogenesis protein CcmG, thiol:disulfide interchange protein DsbE
MQNRKIDRLLLGGIAVLLLTLTAVLSASLREHMAQEGQPAPSFSIRTDAGNVITPEQFGGKLLLLNFWATWCAPCVEEVPTLDALQRRFQKQGLVVVGVSVDENANAYREFLAKNQVAFQTLRDPSKKLSIDYGTFKYPETYLIDSSGRVIKKVIGKEDWTDEHVISYVQSLL